MAISDAEKQKSFDKEIKELITSLTNRLSGIPKSGGDSTQQYNSHDEDGVRIITLTGTNLGATMRGDMDEKPADPEGMSVGGAEEFTTCVNSNFQALNNSIMLGGSYTTNDPGVHLDITEYAEQSASHHRRGKRLARKSEREDEHHTE